MQIHLSMAFRINQWKDISTLWLHGFWQYDWADNYVKVLSIDRSSNEFITDPKTPPVFGMYVAIIECLQYAHIHS